MNSAHSASPSDHLAARSIPNPRSCCTLDSIRPFLSEHLPRDHFRRRKEGFVAALVRCFKEETADHLLVRRKNSTPPQHILTSQALQDQSLNTFTMTTRNTMSIEPQLLDLRSRVSMVKRYLRRKSHPFSGQDRSPQATRSHEKGHRLHQRPPALPLHCLHVLLDRAPRPHGRVRDGSRVCEPSWSYSKE